MSTITESLSLTLNHIISGPVNQISSIVTGGIARYTYTWTPTQPGNSPSILNPSNGTYNLVVMDSSPAVFQQQISATIDIPSQTSVTTSASLSFNTSTSLLTTTVSGETAPYTYEIFPPGSPCTESGGGFTGEPTSSFTFPATLNCTGVYIVQITDSSSPNLTSFINIFIGTPLSLALVYNPGTNPTITSMITAGNPLYNLTWITPYGQIIQQNLSTTSNSISALNMGTLAFGTYSITVTDNSTPIQVATASIFVAPPTTSIQFIDTVTGYLYPNQSTITLTPPNSLSLEIEIANPTSTNYLVPSKIIVYKCKCLYATITNLSTPIVITKPGFYRFIMYLSDCTKICAYLRVVK
jgi:hypothetical protein